MLRKTQSEKIGEKGRKKGLLRATGWKEKKSDRSSKTESNLRTGK